MFSHGAILSRSSENFDGTTDSIADFGPVRAAWFKDSEGSLLNLIEGAVFSPT